MTSKLMNSKVKIKIGQFDFQFNFNDETPILQKNGNHFAFHFLFSFSESIFKSLLGKNGLTIK